MVSSLQTVWDDEASEKETTLNEAILGINLEGTTLYVGKVRDGRLVTQFFHRITADAGEKAVLAEVFQAIDRLAGDDITGMGVGVPSVVDVERGIVYSVANIPSWKKVPLKEILEQKYDVPVHVNNDANALAAGEFYFGEGRGHKDLVGVVLGTGFGLGVVFNGQLSLGSNCGAGEIGHVAYRDSEIEKYCSRKFFDRKTSMQELMLRSRAERGDKEARQLYREFGEHLGHAMQIILYAYDPEILIFGGLLSGAYPFFKDSMLQTMKESFVFPHSVSRLKIFSVEGKSDRSTLGAAALYLDHVQKQRNDE